MKLGCIGDDFTGSSDLANTLARGGMPVTLYAGVPAAPAAPAVEAGVVALKTRSGPAGRAVAEALAALRWLRAQGCAQFFFKYGSTFDSTREGNIGPVLDALIGELDARRVIVCPAFPANGRTLYRGHLFVGDRLLNESGMEHHPLTPMTDPDIRRWLSHQTRHSVGLAAHGCGEEIAAALAREDTAGHRLIVVDALTEADLLAIGTAAKDLPLVSGGSGVALGLPANFGFSPGPAAWRGIAGPEVVLAGSCSEATRRQVEAHLRAHPGFEISADDLMSGALTVGHAAEWVLARSGSGPLVYSSANPEAVRRTQERHGREALAGAIESFFASLAATLAAAGVRRLVAAGGETSGAVVRGLGCGAFEVGPEIDPGVPALRVAGRDMAVALKSGNFGSVDFFGKALAALQGEAA